MYNNYSNVIKLVDIMNNICIKYDTNIFDNIIISCGYYKSFIDYDNINMRHHIECDNFNLIYKYDNDIISENELISLLKNTKVSL